MTNNSLNNHDPCFYDSFRNDLKASVLSCFLYPWYIYKSYCILYNGSIPFINIKLFFKVYFFFPYYIYKIFQTLLLRRTYYINGNNSDFIKKFTTGKIEYYDGIISVIIPVFNGCDDLKKLIPVIKSQIKIKEIEIVIIDSGSNDGTVDFLKKEDIKLLEIPPAEFSHSSTRNLGAKEAMGDILLFMTQDALPPEQDWIFKLIVPIIEYGASAASCVEQPKLNCSIFTGVENRSYRNTYDINDRIIKLPKGKNLWGWWERNTRLNDVACAVKREVFNSFLHQYEFAEDVDLGVRLLKAGHSIALLSSIQIMHSHERSSLYYFKRSYISAKTMKKIMPVSPKSDKSLKKIINSAIFTYYKLQVLFEYIESLQGNFESLDFINFCIDFWNKNDKIDQCKELRFGMWYSSSELDNLLQLLFIYPKSYNDGMNCYIQILKNYLSYFILEYLSSMNIFINDVFRKQVIEAIFKKWLLLLAYDLSLYFYDHPDKNSPLFITLEKLSKGI